ncbi:MAG: TusE/DsrC/DsvC family sulfur relay protein [Chloroflexi bacterium]|nr:TusE/DsrC/DsvC family sulfur relay protein [Chloroflexota bacterium]
MPFVDYKGTQLKVDGDGFIVDPSLWDKDLACFLAKHEEGITELTDDHWTIINYLNAYYKEHDKAPIVRKLCQETGFKLRYIYELFPNGPARGACKVAGLPKPTGCV